MLQCTLKKKVLRTDYLYLSRSTVCRMTTRFTRAGEPKWDFGGTAACKYNVASGERRMNCTILHSEARSFSADSAACTVGLGTSRYEGLQLSPKNGEHCKLVRDRDVRRDRAQARARRSTRRCVGPQCAILQAHRVFLSPILPFLFPFFCPRDKNLHTRPPLSGFC